MVTEAQKKASAKWDKENMVVLACKVKRETAEQFKAACAANGTTSNAVLQQAVKAYLEQAPAQEPPHAAGDASQTDTPRPAHDGVSDEMRNTSTKQDDETEARRAAVLAKSRGCKAGKDVEQCQTTPNR